MSPDALAPIRRILPPPPPPRPSPDENRARLLAAATLMRKVRLDERHSEALTLGGSVGPGLLYTLNAVNLRQAFCLTATAIACTAELIATAQAEGAETMRLHRHRVELVSKAMEMLDTSLSEIAAFIPTHAADTVTALTTEAIGTRSGTTGTPTRPSGTRTRKRTTTPSPKPKGSA